MRAMIWRSLLRYRVNREWPHRAEDASIALDQALSQTPDRRLFGACLPIMLAPVCTIMTWSCLSLTFYGKVVLMLVCCLVLSASTTYWLVWSVIRKRVATFMGGVCACGYDIRFSHADRCPECGQVLSAPNTRRRPSAGDGIDDVRAPG